MNIEITMPSYNSRRYGNPWIAVVSGWTNNNPTLRFGYSPRTPYGGSTAGGVLMDIDCEPGDILRWGQIDLRKAHGNVNHWAIVNHDGTYTPCDQAEARRHWKTRKTASVGG